jgi:uncharacterized membrane protein YcaP (DUF421 family)
MFFDDWYDLGRILVLGMLSYIFLVGALRVSGNRTLAKLNAFDLVVTVALGSTLASILLSSEVSLAEGAVGLGLLIVAQRAVARLSVRWSRVRQVVRSEPSLLVRHGALLGDALQRSRVTEGEVRQAVRSSGIGAMQDVAAVVLETDGTMSVIPAAQLGSASALHEIADWSDGPE